jgi:hypothetical protein
MWKSILITLVTYAVVIAALSLAVAGLTKLLGTEHILPIVLIMILFIFRAVEDPFPHVRRTLTLMLFGSGGPRFTHSCVTLE